LEGELVKTFLLKWLVFPLCVAAFVSMLVSLCVPDPWKSLLVNLAATFLGSIVTVFFVEAILRRGEEQRWKRFRGHVGKQVTNLANATASSIRSALGISLPDSWMDLGRANDPVQMRQMMIGLIEQELLPAISGLAYMDQSKWRILAQNLRNCVQNCGFLLSLFGPRMDAETAALILDLQEKAREVLIPYDILPDLLGVPFEQLKPNRRGESSVPIVKAMLQRAVWNSEQLLTICAKLLREVGERFPERSPNSTRS
jgi:hypothetical protein